MNKKIILILTLISIVTAGGVVYFLSQQSLRVHRQSNVTSPRTSPFAFYPIHEMKQNTLPPGPYDTEGYVVKIYTCPPCPEGALCKPCMGDNIVISETNQLLAHYILSDTEMILFTDHPKQFDLGGKYRFSVKILHDKSTNEPMNNVEILDYTPVENN